MKKKSIYVICHNIRSAYNIGSVFRTAEGAGVEKIIIGGYSPDSIHSKVRKTALGAEILVESERYWQTWRKIEELKEQGFQIICLETSKKGIPYYKFKPKFPCVLVLGNEKRGLSPKILKLSDKILTIPMRGKKESLNVSVAFGIVVYYLSNY